MELPPYWIPRPASRPDHVTVRAFDELLAQAMEHGPDRPIDYRLDAPKWQFLCHVADRADIVLHGSGDADIPCFEPRQPADTLDFSNRRAVFAATDGIWPMPYATLDRDRHPTVVTVNSCIRLGSADGDSVSPPTSSPSASGLWIAGRGVRAWSIFCPQPASRDSRRLRQTGTGYTLRKPRTRDRSLRSPNSPCNPRTSRSSIPFTAMTTKCSTLGSRPIREAFPGSPATPDERSSAPAGRGPPASRLGRTLRVNASRPRVVLPQAGSVLAVHAAAKVVEAFAGGGAASWTSDSPSVKAYSPLGHRMDVNLGHSRGARSGRRHGGGRAPGRASADHGGVDAPAQPPHPHPGHRRHRTGQGIHVAA